MRGRSIDRIPGKPMQNSGSRGPISIFEAAALEHRINLPDDRPISPTDQEVIEVLTTADHRQRRLLKKIAEGLIREVVLGNERTAPIA